jgi:phenol hydroxylase P4 protein
VTTIAITPDYRGELRDTLDKFHGQQLLNVGWDRHLLFAAPMCILVCPDMCFGDLIDTLVPKLFGAHPDFARIRWPDVRWLRSGQAFAPDRAASIRNNGLGHKAILRMQTPGLHGIRGSCT